MDTGQQAEIRDPDTLSPGSCLGPYKVTGVLGSGGMGKVYRATDTRLGRSVALKVLPSASADDSSRRRRLMEEARNASVLSHPNIVTLHDIASDNGTDFLVMEYVPGTTLNRLIPSGGLPVDEALRYAMQIAAGLAAAHALGIVHRDIKPGNLAVTPDSQVKILDFGLAKHEEAVLAPDAETVTQEPITAPGTVAGTVAYMSPEQVEGRAVDHRSDIFSLGVVFYEMLAGQRPFLGGTHGMIMRQIVLETPAPVSSLRREVSPALASVVEKALCKNPRDRYQSAQEFLADLRQVNSPGRRRWQAAAAITALALTLASTAWWSRARWFSPVPEEKRVVVLPFQAVGSDTATQALCDGLTEILSAKLTQLEPFQGSLWVVSANEVRRQAVHSAREARKAFGVNLAIAGTLQRNQGKMVLTASLVDAVTQRQLRSLAGERIADSSVLQDETVARIAGMLQLELQPQALEKLSSGRTAAPGAYDFYLQGYGYLRRPLSIQSADDAAGLFRQALSRDPGYALAFAGLGEAYWRKWLATRDNQWVSLAEENCRRAVAINPKLAPAHAALGLVQRGRGQYEEAIREYQLSLDLDSTNADSWTGLAAVFEASGQLDQAEATFRKAIDLRPGYWAGYSYLAEFYVHHGRYREAAALFRRVVDLTPDNYIGYRSLGGVNIYLDEFDEAAENLLKSVELKPTAAAYTNLGALRFSQGRFAEAVENSERAIQLGPETHILAGNLADCYRWAAGMEAKAPPTYRRAIALAEKQLAVNPKDAGVLASLAAYHAKLGDLATADLEIERADRLAPGNSGVLYQSAVIAELSGRRDLALRRLAEAVRAGYPASQVLRDPEMQALRKDSRSRQILK